MDVQYAEIVHGIKAGVQVCKFMSILERKSAIDIIWWHQQCCCNTKFNQFSRKRYKFVILDRG